MCVHNWKNENIGLVGFTDLGSMRTFLFLVLRLKLRLADSFIPITFCEEFMPRTLLSRFFLAFVFKKRDEKLQLAEGHVLLIFHWRKYKFFYERCLESIGARSKLMLQNELKVFAQIVALISTLNCLMSGGFEDRWTVAQVSHLCRLQMKRHVNLYIYMW